MLSAARFRLRVTAIVFVHCLAHWHRSWPSFRQLLLYDYESLANFVQHGVEVSGQEHLFGVDDHVCACAGNWPAEANGLAQAALHTITLYGSPQSATHGESDTKTRAYRNFDRTRCLPVQIENCHGRGEVPAALFVHAFEVGVP